MSSAEHADPKHLPLTYRQPVGRPDIDQQLREWASGTRGPAALPSDFFWRTSPKEKQEENGAAAASSSINPKPA